MDKADRILQGRVLLGCLLGVASGYSSIYFYSSGSLLIPISKDLGLSRGEASMGIVASSLTAAVLAPFVGRSVDRFGAKRVALFSLIGLGISFWLAAWFATGMASFLGAMMLIAALGAGSTSVSFSRLVVDAFERRRGMALAIMQTGAGLGAFLLPLIVAPILAQSDWRDAYRVLGSISITMTVVVALLFATKLPASNPETVQAQLASKGWDVWSSRPFLLLGMTFLFAAAAIAGAIVHFVPLMIDDGVSASQAAQLGSLLGVALIGGRLATGWLLDQFVPEFIAAGLFILAAAGFLILAFAGAQFALPGALIVGIAMGSEVDLLSYLCAKHFPRHRYGTAYGGAFGVFLVGSSIGPGLMGTLYDRTGDYQVGLTVASTLLVAATVSVIALRWLCPRQNEADQA
jgi:MFS family permease